MKALYTIAALTIANSFSLYAMEDEKYIGLEKHHPNYYYDMEWKTSNIYTYCAPSWKDRWRNNTKNPHNCAIVNAYILLSGRPNESVEEQIKFYEQRLGNIETESSSTFDVFKKHELKQQKSLLQASVQQIKNAHLSGKLQDRNIQEQLSSALHNMDAYSTWELNNIKAAAQKANQCNLLDNNK